METCTTDVLASMNCNFFKGPTAAYVWKLISVAEFRLDRQTDIFPTDAVLDSEASYTLRTLAGVSLICNHKTFFLF